jgi:hypothetical protein
MVARDESLVKLWCVGSGSKKFVERQAKAARQAPTPEDSHTKPLKRLKLTELELFSLSVTSGQRENLFLPRGRLRCRFWYACASKKSRVSEKEEKIKRITELCDSLFTQ